MEDTTIYSLTKLQEMKLNNDDYIANKAMYRELEQIKLLVLGQNNLYGPTNPVIYNFTYDDVKTPTYYDTLVTMLIQMFPNSSTNKIDNGVIVTISFNQ